MRSLVLASKSPARAQLLREAGVVFQAAAAPVNEAALKAEALGRGARPKEVAGELAAAKALAVAVAEHRLGIVVGADQTLELEGALFDKPLSLQAAREQLQALRGRTHALHSAVALASGGDVVWRHVDTAVLTVRAFSDDFLASYLQAEGEPLLGCVGAYRLEGLGAQLFERVEGDYFTVLGLPLLPLLAELRRRGELAT